MDKHVHRQCRLKATAPCAGADARKSKGAGDTGEAATAWVLGRLCDAVQEAVTGLCHGHWSENPVCLAFSRR